MSAHSTYYRRLQKIGSLFAALSDLSSPNIIPKLVPIGCTASQAPLKHNIALAPKVANLSKGEFRISNLSDFNKYLICLTL